MAYDFSRFSPQSFERLVQAMAAATVGGRVQIYGAGKDGAREATFMGKCRLTEDIWDGYVVFQAKHRGITDKSVSNAEWLVKQIDDELKKFEDNRRSLKRPEYYVIASNVRLTAAAADVSGKGGGGIDKVTQHLESWSARLGLKGTHLWHADTLSALLDVHEGVRSIFDFWVQPGEVLAQVMRQLAGPKQDEVLARYLRHGLRASRDIKTRDIGQAAGRTITLDDVFVDLPFSRYALTDSNSVHASQLSRSDLHDEGVGFHSDEWSPEWDFIDLEPPKVLAELINRASDSFHPQTWMEGDEETSDQKDRPQNSSLPNRIVLLGGPGQGKSTIGQFLAQLLRARLLKALQSTQTPETNRAVNAILRSGESQSVPIAGALRYPFHVELPRFANALSDAEMAGDHLSILSYLAREISRASDVRLVPMELERWLGQIPSCIILDGLDEVPHSSNRAAVIVAIEELLDTIHQSNSDSLIFTTSRPQGYQEELSPEFWAHWQLTALRPSDALDVARRVAPVLIGDEDRRVEVLAILSEAANEDATASLMISPLQVMMLFHLVSTHNNIPRDRWTLFRRHYEMLCEREIAKSGQLGNMIRDFRPQIDSIHYDAGYLLHLRAEVRGGADSFFTVKEFAALVGQHLARDGYGEDQNFEQLTSAIANLATNRLVFLRSAVEGSIAFDVRSLQEFMAAARLTSSPENCINDRLAEIAGRSHWSHVFKIACAKIYASTGHEALREPIVALLDSLDAGDRDDDDRVLRTGSRLALELLNDGIATSVPLFRRKLVARAAKLLSMPVGISIWALRGALDLQYRQVLEPVFREALGAEAPTRISMLRLLTLISRQDGGQDLSWVDALLHNAWPESPSEVLEIFDDVSLLPARNPFAQRLRDAQWLANPGDVIPWAGSLSQADPDEPTPPPGLLICSGLPVRRTVVLRGPNGSRVGLLFIYYGLRDAIAVDEVPAGAHPLWLCLRAASEFAADPSIRSADAFLEVVEACGQLDAIRRLSLPWVLTALLARVPAVEPINFRRKSLRAGNHGDETVWQAAEYRWNEVGIDESEILPPSQWRSVSPDIATHGGPFVVGSRHESRLESAEEPLLALISRYPNDDWAIRTLLFHTARDPSPIGRNRRSFLLAESTITAVAKRPAMANYVQALVNALQTPPTDAELLARLCKIVPDIWWTPLNGSRSLQTVIRLFVESPNSRALIPLLASCAVSATPMSKGARVVIPEAALENVADDPQEVRVSSAALRLLDAGIRGTFDQEDIELVVVSSGPLATRLVNHLTRDRGSESRSTFVVAALSRAMVARQRDNIRSRAYQMLLNVDEVREVRLSDTARAAELHLPPPLPRL